MGLRCVGRANEMYMYLITPPMRGQARQNEPYLFLDGQAVGGEARAHHWTRVVSPQIEVKS